MSRAGPRCRASLAAGWQQGRGNDGGLGGGLLRAGCNLAIAMEASVLPVQYECQATAATVPAVPLCQRLAGAIGEKG